MPATRADETRRLRALHESYAEQVNAAIGERQDDRVRDLVDQYLADAMNVLVAGHGSGCGRPACPTCSATPPTHLPPVGRLEAFRRFFRRSR